MVISVLCIVFGRPIQLVAYIDLTNAQTSSTVHYLLYNFNVNNLYIFLSMYLLVILNTDLVLTILIILVLISGRYTHTPLLPVLNSY